MKSLQQKSLLRISDCSQEEIKYLLDLAVLLKRKKKEGKEIQFLKGKNIALIFEKDSTRTRCAFEVAAADQGAKTTYLSSESQIGKKESIKDSARVLGRMFQGIEYRGFSQQTVEILAHYAGVPVWNGLTDSAHPTQALADLLTMQEHNQKPLSQMKVCYAGNACNNVSNSLMVACLKMGMDFRIAAPKSLNPENEILKIARKEEKENGGCLTITDNLKEAIFGCDFIYTDVWLSMGEDETLWEERIKRLEPFRITSEIMNAAQNHQIRFMHCLPACHNTETSIGQKIYDNFGIKEMEVTEEVFESEASIVFDQAENRLHTIKAVMVATLTENLL